MDVNPYIAMDAPVKPSPGPGTHNPDVAYVGAWERRRIGAGCDDK